MGLFSKIVNYGIRGAKLLPELLLGTGSEVVGQGMRAAKGSIWTKAKAGGKALETEIANAAKAGKGGFFKRTFSSLKGIPGELKAAKGLKGCLKVLGKRMPAIGAVITVAIEAPNIIKAFKEGGFKAGIKEIGGAGIELGGMAAGAAIGSAICPGVGTLIGGIIGGLAGSFVRGKTYTDKQKEQEEKLAQNEQLQAIEQLKAMGYDEEEILKAMQTGIKPTDLLEAVQQQAPLESQSASTVVPNTAQQAKVNETSAQTNQTIAQSYVPTVTNPFSTTSPLYNFSGVSMNNYTDDIYYKSLFGSSSNSSLQPYNYQKYNLGYNA